MVAPLLCGGGRRRRAVAFVGVAMVDGFAPTVAFALLAGVGTALFTPATLASLPSLVEKERLPGGHVPVRGDRRRRPGRGTRARRRWCWWPGAPRRCSW